MSRQANQPAKQYIPGTSIEVRPVRDLWAEQGYSVDRGNNITPIRPTVTPSTNDTPTERRHFWQR